MGNSNNRKRPHDDITVGKKTFSIDEDTETCTTESTKIDDPVDDDSNYNDNDITKSSLRSARRIRLSDGSRNNNEILVHHQPRALAKKAKRSPIDRTKRPFIPSVFDVEEFPPRPFCTVITTPPTVPMDYESITPNPSPVKVVTQSPSTTVGDQSSVATPTTTTNNNAAKLKCSVCKIRMQLESCSQQACLNCCTDVEKCEGHKKRRQQANFKAQILEGTHFVQKEAARIRELKIQPETRKLLHIREPNIIYQGETIVIWDIRTYMRNPKWREDARRKSIKRLTSSVDQGITTRNSPVNGRRKTEATTTKNGRGRRGTTATTTTKSQLHTDLFHGTLPKSTQQEIFGPVLRNNRQRFRRIMERLYQDSLRATTSEENSLSTTQKSDTKTTKIEDSGMATATS
jgi:hypothetical protein